MDIIFDNKKLEKYANNDKHAFQKLGKKRAVLYKQRLDDLRDATCLEDVKHLPGHFHELTSDRKGEWSCNLGHPYRLIFTPIEKPMPTNNDGQCIWLEIKGVEIIEIADYH